MLISVIDGEFQCQLFSLYYLVLILQVKLMSAAERLTFSIRYLDMPIKAAILLLALHRHLCLKQGKKSMLLYIGELEYTQYILDTSYVMVSLSYFQCDL